MASMLNASWLGVMTAAANAMPRTAQRRFFLRNLSSMTPTLASSTSTTGSSKTTPKARMKSAMKVKYSCARSWTLKNPELKLSRKLRPLGSTRKYASATPAKKRTVVANTTG